MNIDDIDFDNVEQVRKFKDQKVEVTVGLIYSLLGSYYQGGGEPDSYNERLAEVSQHGIG